MLETAPDPERTLWAPRVSHVARLESVIHLHQATALKEHADAEALYWKRADVERVHNLHKLPTKLGKISVIRTTAAAEVYKSYVFAGTEKGVLGLWCIHWDDRLPIRNTLVAVTRLLPSAERSRVVSCLLPRRLTRRIIVTNNRMMFPYA
jgi:hypothetical protein